MQRLLWPDTSIKAAAIKSFTFGMADFILLLDKGEPDSGAQYVFIFIGNKIAVARVWHEIIDCAHDKNAEVNCVCLQSIGRCHTADQACVPQCIRGLTYILSANHTAEMAIVLKFCIRDPVAV
jgi:hypothetical protein